MPQSLGPRLGAPLRALTLGFPTMALPIILGIGFVWVMAGWRLHLASGDRRQFLAMDPFAGLFVSFPPLVFWSLVDFQSYPDLFVFLPYAALGFGWLLVLSLEGLGRIIPLSAVAEAWSVGILCTALLGFAAVYYRITADRKLLMQRQ